MWEQWICMWCWNAVGFSIAVIKVWTYYWMCFYKMHYNFEWIFHVNTAPLLYLGSFIPHFTLTSTTFILDFLKSALSILNATNISVRLLNRIPLESECNNQPEWSQRALYRKIIPNEYAKNGFQKAHSQQRRCGSAYLESICLRITDDCSYAQGNWSAGK